MLPFVHPGIALSGVLLAALPILIHILNRRRFRRVVWAAMDFLAAAHRRNARRVRIEQMILLALRVLILVLVAGAIARPLIGRSGIGVLGETTFHRVIVLDTSYSMRMKDGSGRTAFDRARAAAEKLAEGFGRNDGVSLIVAGAAARTILDQPTCDRPVVLNQVRRCEPSDATTDMVGALSLAAAAVGKARAPQGNRMVYVLTDGTAVAWSGGDASRSRRLRDVSERLGKLARLFVIDLGPARRENVALSGLRLAGPLLSADYPAVLEAQVSNWGAQAVAGARLQVSLNGQGVRVEPIESVPPGGSTRMRFRLRLPASGSHQIMGKISGVPADVLETDDTRWLSLWVRREVPVLLVDGRPGGDRYSGSTGYLVAALSPDSGSGEPTRIIPRTILPAELGIEPLDDYVMVALCNVRQLPEPTWRLLDRYVRGGGSLCVFAGDQLLADDYNRNVVAAGRGVLPGRIEGFAGSLESQEKFVRVRPADLTHPSVSDFAEQPQSGLFLARFFRHVRMAPVGGDAGSTVALRFDSGDPALIVGSLGLGRVAMAGFTANMDWTNLPAKGDYVSLVLGLTTWLAGEPASGRNILVDQVFSEPLTEQAAVRAIEITRPDGRRSEGFATSRPGAEKRVLRFEQTDRAGAYTLKRGSELIDFAVNVDPAEGDLRAIRPNALKEALACDVEYSADVEGTLEASVIGARREIGWILLCVVLALLIVESVLAMRFGHHRD